MDAVAGDLERRGYAVWGRIIAARDVGAPHRRERLFLVAHARRDGRRGRTPVDGAHPRVDEQAGDDAARRGHRDRGALADAASARRRRPGRARLGDRGRPVAAGRGAALANADGERVRHLAGRDQQDAPERAHAEPVYDGAAAGRAAQPRMGRDLDGPAHRVELPGRWPAPRGRPQHDWEPPRALEGVPDRRPRLRALGNAVVPHVARLAGELVRALDEAPR